MTYDFSPFKAKIKEKEEWLKKEFSQIRTGRASISALDGVSVLAYGGSMPIEGVATMALEDARTIRIAPWDPANLKGIERGIVAAGLGLTVSVDEKGVRVFFPELTSERRQIVVKTAKEKLEDARIGLRKVRDETIKYIEQKEKQGGMGEDEKFRLKGEAQKLTDAANNTFDELYQRKEKEILN